MGWLKNTVQVSLSIVLVVSLIVFMACTAVYSLLYPNIYLKVLDKNNAYNLISEQSKTLNLEILYLFNNENSKEIISNILLESLDYVRGDKDELNLTIYIGKDALYDFLVDKVRDYPICDSPNTDSIDLRRESCKSDSLSAEEFVNKIISQNNPALLDNYKIDLKPVIDKENDLDKARTYVRFYKLVFFLAGLTALILIAVFLILNLRVFYKTLFWLGADFIFAGILFFVLSIFLLGLANRQISDLAVILQPYVSDLAFFVLARARIYSAVIGAAGALVLLGGILLRNKR